MPADGTDAAIERAAEAIAAADALLIGAGAGMGVDSGLPDFRGPEGFWKAYPPFRGRQFHEMSNPIWFRSDPELAWGFFGHRLNLYRSAVPHEGFEILRRWASRMSQGAFVFTSNVDGLFPRAGFDEDRFFEVHGTLMRLQCAAVCSRDVWETDDLAIDVDPETIRACSELPTCPRCGSVARPNVLMFGDYDWVSDRSDSQEMRYRQWCSERLDHRVVAVEMGAGTAIPTVRVECEYQGHPLVRINPRDPEVPAGDIGIPLGAADALRRIDALLDGTGTPDAD